MITLILTLYVIMHFMIYTTVDCQKHEYAVIEVLSNLIRIEYFLSTKLPLPISKKGN